MIILCIYSLNQPQLCVTYLNHSLRMAIGENAYHFFPKHFAELRSWRMRRDLAATGA